MRAVFRNTILGVYMKKIYVITLLLFIATTASFEAFGMSRFRSLFATTHIVKETKMVSVIKNTVVSRSKSLVSFKPTISKEVQEKLRQQKFEKQRSLQSKRLV